MDSKDGLGLFRLPRSTRDEIYQQVLVIDGTSKQVGAFRTRKANAPTGSYTPKREFVSALVGY